MNAVESTLSRKRKNEDEDVQSKRHKHIDQNYPILLEKREKIEIQRIKGRSIEELEELQKVLKPVDIIEEGEILEDDPYATGELQEDEEIPFDDQDDVL